MACLIGMYDRFFKQCLIALCTCHAFSKATYPNTPSSYFLLHLPILKVELHLSEGNRGIR